MPSGSPGCAHTDQIRRVDSCWHYLTVSREKEEAERGGSLGQDREVEQVGGCRREGMEGWGVVGREMVKVGWRMRGLGSGGKAMFGVLMI